MRPPCEFEPRWLGPSLLSLSMTVESHTRIASSAKSRRQRFWALGRALNNDAVDDADGRVVVRLAGSEIEQLAELFTDRSSWFSQRDDWERVTKLLTNPSPVDLLGGLSEP